MINILIMVIGWICAYFLGIQRGKSIYREDMQHFINKKMIEFISERKKSMGLEDDQVKL